MGRSAIRHDLRRRPETFSLGQRDRALVAWYAKTHDISKSEALRALLEIAEAALNGDERREVAKVRLDLASEARSIAAVPMEQLTKCPSCGDPDGFVKLTRGRWRCDFCGARG